MISTRHRLGIAGMAVILGASLTACGGSDSTDTAADTGTTTDTSSSAPATEPSSSSTDASATTFGDGCASIPSSGSGSLEGMVADPVATAASNNPLLSTLVTAVKAAGLVDTLNSTDGITVFAPDNAAFEKVPADQLQALLTDKAALTKVLSYHVIPKRLTPEELTSGGPFKTLEGDMVTVSGSVPTVTVGSNDASVVCGGIQTANATVYVLDSVLAVPTSGSGASSSSTAPSASSSAS